MKIYKRMAVTFSITAIWILFFILDSIFGLMPLISGKGFTLLDGEYYRLFTGFLLHGNVLHLAANALTMYWFGCHLERNIGSVRFLLFSVISVLISQPMYYLLLPDIDNAFGGSFLTFAYIGLIVALQLFKPDFPRFRLGTWYGNWILIYAIVGNIPLFSFINITTLALHGISLAVGFVLGAVAILAKKIRRSK